MANPQFSQNINAETQKMWSDKAQHLVGADAPQELVTALAPILASSSHLERLATVFTQDIFALWQGQHKRVLSDTRAKFTSEMTMVEKEEHAYKAVREYRNRSHMAVALSELWGHLEFDDSLSILSHCAEHAVSEAVGYLLRPVSASECGWVVLALGKLGAAELNYSSDIDLICLHDPSTALDHFSTSHTDPGAFFSLKARQLAQLLSAQTADGFGWRVDYRLRPDPGATPASLAIDAAISYYESLGRSWERAAFIRARPIAGNLNLGSGFLDAISSFIWRRSLDYTAIDDMAVMLRHEPNPPDYLGFNVKTGAWGIRHIELLCHCLQLLGGGRHPELRARHTAHALNSLAGLGWISDETATQITSCYVKWRQIEHRIQYRQDSHTHSLPRNEDDFTNYAGFLGFADTQQLRLFLDELQCQTQASLSHPLMDRLLAGRKGHDENKTHPVISLASDSSDLEAELSGLGFERAQDVSDMIKGWNSGRIPATRSDKARYYLDQMLPEFLSQIALCDTPDNAFFAFADIINSLPAGAQIFALFTERPELVRLLSDCLTGSDLIATMLSQNPALFDLLLEPDFFRPLPNADELSAFIDDVTATKDVEQQLHAISLFKSEQHFKAALHLYRDLSTAHEVSAFLSTIADSIISRICALAIDEISLRYGQLEQFEFAVFGLGRLGSTQLGFTSDLDLLFVYSGNPEQVSDGPKAIGHTGLALKLSQRILSFLSTRDKTGVLYQTDTRLRPDGQSGALAITEHGLQDYLEHRAWPWEHIAFRKLRPVFQLHASHLSRLTENIEHSMQTLPLDRLVSDIEKMRARLAAQTPSAFDLKKMRGGFIDLDFLNALRAHSELNQYSASDAYPNQEQGPVDDAAQKLHKAHTFAGLCGDNFKSSEQPDIYNSTHIIADACDAILDYARERIRRPI